MNSLDQWDGPTNPDVFTAIAIVNAAGCNDICDVRQINMSMLPEIIEEAIYMECLVDLINYIGTIRPALVPELYKEVLKIQQQSVNQLVTV